MGSTSAIMDQNSMVGNKTFFPPDFARKSFEDVNDITAEIHAGTYNLMRFTRISEPFILDRMM